MINLASTSDVLRVITTAAITTDVHVSWVDLVTATGAVTPGRTNSLVTTATTTTAVAAPSSGTIRNVKSLSIRNRHATTAQTVTVVHYDGTNAAEMIRVTLAAGDQLLWTEGRGFWVIDSQGRERVNSSNNGSGAAVNALNLVVLAADVTNNNVTANTIADVTGLSFSVTAGETYFFRATIRYTAAATTTGSRWSINGPASPTALGYHSRYGLTATTETVNYVQAYDAPAAANATSVATTGNIAYIEGFITPSASGTVIVRFASEITASAIVAQAGSTLEWIRVL